MKVLDGGLDFLGKTRCLGFESDGLKNGSIMSGAFLIELICLGFCLWLGENNLQSVRGFFCCWIKQRLVQCSMEGLNDVVWSPFFNEET